MNKFPVLMNKRQRAVYSRCPEFIDADLLDNNHAKMIHGQDLDRLAKRGGLSPAEIIGNIRRWDYKQIKSFSIYSAVQLLQKLAIPSND